MEQLDPTPAAPARPLSRIGQWLANTRDLAGQVRQAPFQSAALTLAFVVLGWIGQDAYNWAKSAILPVDDDLALLAADQREGFAALQASLDALRAEGGGAALADVRDAVRALERSADANLDKLRLARAENETLRRSLQQSSGAVGGYDVLLSAQQSVQLDPGTVLGVNRIATSWIRVTLSTPDSAGQARTHTLNPGESLPYRKQSGEDCSVTLLSLLDGADAASFAIACRPPAPGASA